MGHSEVCVFVDSLGPELYCSGELRRDGCWIALIEGPHPKYGLKRRFVGTKAPSEANPGIEVALVRSSQLPSPCLLEVQAGGTATRPYRHIVIHEGGHFTKLTHSRSDEAILSVKRGASAIFVAEELLRLADVKDMQIVAQPRSRALTT